MKKVKNKNKRWTKNEDEKLVNMFAQGIKRNDIALFMDRTTASIDARVEVLRKKGEHGEKLNLRRTSSGHRWTVSKRTQKRNGRIHKRWTNTEDEKLYSLWWEHKDNHPSMKDEIAKELGRTKAACNTRFYLLMRQRRNDAYKQRPRGKKINPVDDFESVTKILAEKHKEIEAKCAEQRLVIEDTIVKLDVLLGKLRKVLE